MEKICLNCEYFDEGLCIINPPVLVSIQGLVGCGEPVTRFPKVSIRDRCGKFKGKEYHKKEMSPPDKIKLIDKVEINSNLLNTIIEISTKVNELVDVMNELREEKAQ